MRKRSKAVPLPCTHTEDEHRALLRKILGGDKSAFESEHGYDQELTISIPAVRATDQPMRGLDEDVWH